MLGKLTRIFRKTELPVKLLLGKPLSAISIQDIAYPIQTFSDTVSFGSQNFSTSRGIYELSEIICFKDQLLLTPKDGSILNVIGAKALRRNNLCWVNVFELFAIKNSQKIQCEEVSFFFLPHNKKKANYWHCLFDNISQLLFVLAHTNVKNVFVPNDTGEMIRDYVKFLQKHYKFQVSYLDHKPIKVVGKIVFTEPSMLAGFENNEAIAERLRANAKAQLKKDGAKVVQETIKFGSIPHLFHVADQQNRVLTYKNFHAPWTTPIRHSSLATLNKFGGSFGQTNSAPRQITYIVRNSERNRNPENELEVRAKLGEALEINFVDLARLSYQEQINLARSSYMLIGVNGAGLANMAFMQTPASVVEIIPPDFSLPSSQIIKAPAEALGLNYIAITGGKLSNAPGYAVDIKNIVYKILTESKKLKA